MSKAEKEAERILKLHAVIYLCDWTAEYEVDMLATERHAIIHVEGIIENYRDDFNVAKELHPHVEGLVAGNLVIWQEVLTILKNK